MNYVYLIVCLLVLGITLYFVFTRLLGNSTSTGWKSTTQPLTSKQKQILANKVNYYQNLSPEEKTLFEHKTKEFLHNVSIIGVDTTVTEEDQILVASSAIIPIFKFPNWRYLNLSEVILYPSHFNHHFQTDGNFRFIKGMVGTGYMEGKMILSKPTLHHGFSNTKDKQNTAIHEFVHLIDKADGKIDGVPRLLLEEPNVIPWLNLMQKHIQHICNEESDIEPYGATSNIEFFSVSSEYFFERPKLMKKKHPELYSYLEEIFDQDMTKRVKSFSKKSTGRNEKCPCGSGKKFKHCCLVN